MNSIIQSHNKKILSTTTNDQPPCNCKNKNDCPLNGNCRTSSVIYKCEVTAPNQPKKIYIGLTEKEFKTRYNGHTQSFNNPKYQNSTTLSTHLWKLKQQKINPQLQWSIIKKVKPYTNTTKSCSFFYFPDM